MNTIKPLPSIRIVLLAIAFAMLAAVPARAQADDQDDDPSPVKLAEPDFSLVGLPTGLRLPKYKSAFRVTHRFTRQLNDDFGDVLGDMFGLDSGGSVGLEYRFGIIPNGQVGFHRRSSKTIAFFSEYRVVPQRRSPIEVSAFASIEGTDNFSGSFSPALGAIVSRTVGTRLAAYVTPMWVNNTNELPKALVDHNDTVMLGLGARIRIRSTVYLVAEAAPRIAGDRPNGTQRSFAIEKRAGGHLFQLNFSNGFGTTMADIARGVANPGDWYLGFNLSRKFF
jgi:hypothetical protein